MSDEFDWFDDVTVVDPEMGGVRFVRCNTCHAMIRGRDTERHAQWHALPEIIDAAIIRNPQPDDVLVLRLDSDRATAATAQAVRDAAQRQVGCKVLVLAGVSVERFEVVAWL